MKNVREPAIRFRGHHLICLHFFKGEGYNSEFIENLSQLINRARAGTKIKVSPEADDVCRMCPYLKNEECFYNEVAEAEIREMDSLALKLLRLKKHDIINWLNIKDRIPDVFGKWAAIYCRECSWRRACAKNEEFNRMFAGN
jgi:hypothetical protein